MQPNPFRGLAPYLEGDTLFERDGDVDLIKSRLWSGRYTVLFAGSGVGKTSFLRAKLIGALKEGLDLNIVMPDAWTERDPVAALNSFRETIDSQTNTGTSLLILDQFEEVFQSFPNIVLFNAIGRELSAFANTSSATEVRVLLSVREEFLAELSSFEDFMPGLFTNYYRLERPTVLQAKSIILNTARIGGAAVSSNIDLLLDELRLIKGTQATNSNVIDPPYLQIVCQRIWNEEQPGGSVKFLETYVRGRAAAELERYTREKLERMGWRDRVMLSKVVTHLAGPHEAKKYMRLTDLANHIGARNPDKLRRALDPLCSEQVRILKGRNDVYGLYHDMYAPMLWNWREEQLQLHQRVTIAKWVFISIAIIVFLIYPFAMWLRVQPRLQKPEYGNIDAYTDVRDMRNALSHTAIWRWLGDMWWRSYNRKLATLAALKGDTDAAVLYRLAANSVVGLPADTNNAHRIAKPEVYLLATLDAQTSDGIADAMLLARDGRSQYVIEGTTTGHFVRIPLNNEGDDLGGTTPEPVSVKIEPPSTKGGEAMFSPQIRLLSFVPGGDEALVAWVNPPDDAGPTERSVAKSGVPEVAKHKFAIHVASFLISTGERTGHFNFELTRDAFASKNVSTGIETETPSVGNIPIPIEILSILQEMYVSFSPDSKQVAVIANGVPFVFDTNGKELRSLPVKNAVKIQFMNENSLVMAQGLGHSALGPSPTAEDESVSFCDLIKWTNTDMNPCALSNFTLRPDARLVFRGGTSILVQKHSHWVWAQADGSSEPFEVPDAIPGFAPQIFYENKTEPGWLLAKDSYQRLFIVSSEAKTSVPFLLVSTEPRFERDSSSWTPASRKLTAASLLSVSTLHKFISLDSNGKSARLWQIPQNPLSSELPSPAVSSLRVTEAPADTYFSVDGAWKAVVSGTHLTVNGANGPKEPWVIDELPSREVKSVLLSATGRRALIFYEDELAYAQRKDGNIGGLPVLCYTSGASVQSPQGALGPGPDRITLVTPDQVMIHNPSVAWGICGKEKTAEPEWSAHITGTRTRFLERSTDENGIVLYSGRWAHRITEGSGHWPHVTSVFSDVQLDSTILEPEKIDDTRRLKVSGTESTIAFESEEANDNALGASWLRVFWSSPFNLTLCDTSDTRGRGFGLTDDEIRQSNKGQLPTEDWRTLMCHMEDKTSRRAGDGQ
jgi:hypothetical protein